MGLRSFFCKASSKSFHPSSGYVAASSREFIVEFNRIEYRPTLQCVYIVTVIRRTKGVSVPCNTCPGGSPAEDPSGYFDRCVPASAPQELPRGSRGSLAETNRPSGSVHTLPYHFCYPFVRVLKHSGHGEILAQRFLELMSPDRVLISFLIACATTLERRYFLSLKKERQILL